MMRRAAWVATIGLAAAVSGCGGSGSTGGTTAHSPAQAERVYRVPSGSMEPTVGPGAEVSISAGSPKVGEIVVFHPPEAGELDQCGPAPHTVTPGGRACEAPVAGASKNESIKRVVAGPGDQLYIKEGNVYRQAAGSSGFVRQSDSFTRPCGQRPECNFPTPIPVPPGSWYLLGDNRGQSADSRFYGAVPGSWIVGIVTACAPTGGRPTTLAQRTSARACRLQSG